MKIFTYSVVIGFDARCNAACPYCVAHQTAHYAKGGCQVDRQQLVYQKAQPVPFLDYSLEREAVIQLYKARNSTVATHTVWRGDTSVIEDDCPSIGYPIPYDTSLTNPLQAYGTSSGRTSIEMPEPNGLYSSKNSIATWVRCVTDEGITPVPVEAKVTTYPYPVKVNYETNRVYKAGRATLTIKHKAQ